MNYLYSVLLLFVLTFFLNYLPIIGKIYRVVNTLFHESAHAFTALLTNAEVIKINLFSDSSGSALTKSKYWIGKFLVSIAGYTGSSIAGFFLWKLILCNQLKIIFFVFVLLSIINLIFWVRNWYGVLWLILFIATLVCSFLFLSLFYFRYVLMFFIFSILINSLLSTIFLLRISLIDSKNSGDAYNLKTFTFIPALFWAISFMCFSIFILYKELNLFWIYYKYF